MICAEVDLMKKVKEGKKKRNYNRPKEGGKLRNLSEKTVRFDKKL